VNRQGAASLPVIHGLFIPGLQLLDQPQSTNKWDVRAWEKGRFFFGKVDVIGWDTKNMSRKWTYEMIEI